MAMTGKGRVVAVAVAVMALAMVVAVARGAGECGSTPITSVAAQLSSCATAASNVKAPVPAMCCSQIGKVMKLPRCLCAVLLSPIAKNAGINPAVAITLPQRCRISNRPVGKRCGRYTVP